MNKKIYIGIDCGLDGGHVAIDGAGNIIESGPAFTNKLGKGREIDIQSYNAFFDTWKQKAIGGEWVNGGLDHVEVSLSVIIENPGEHAPSAAGLRSMTACFWSLKAVMICLGIRYHEVRSQAWQKEFWTKPKMPKGQKFDTKAAALSEARKLWPGFDFLASDRCKKPHDGLVDSALIAEYGRRRGI